MPFAEACLTLYEETEKNVYREAVYRWAKIIANTIPANRGKGAYADQYGRCIHFLHRSGRVLGDSALSRQAQELALVAVGKAL